MHVALSSVQLVAVSTFLTTYNALGATRKSHNRNLRQITLFAERKSHFAITQYHYKWNLSLNLNTNTHFGPSVNWHLIQRLSATRLLASAAPGGLPTPSVPFALIVILVAVAAGGSVTTSGAGPGVL